LPNDNSIAPCNQDQTQKLNGAFSCAKRLSELILRSTYIVREMTRRNLLGRSIAVLVSSKRMLLAEPPLSANTIRKRIKPIFRKRDFEITKFGAVADGCDPESCDAMLIAECSLSTGDDCVAVKAGRNRDGRRVSVPCQNVLIRDCLMKDGHGGVSVGREVSGGVRNILTENCQMSSPNLERPLRLKTNSYRGGVIENIGFRNVTMGEVKEAVMKWITSIRKVKAVHTCPWFAALTWQT
jgi:hypothetical protein